MTSERSNAEFVFLTTVLELLNEQNEIVFLEEKLKVFSIDVLDKILSDLTARKIRLEEQSIRWLDNAPEEKLIQQNRCALDRMELKIACVKNALKDKRSSLGALDKQEERVELEEKIEVLGVEMLEKILHAMSSLKRELNAFIVEYGMNSEYQRDLSNVEMVMRCVEKALPNENSSLVLSISELPPELSNKIYGYFSSRELAEIQTVRKDFFDATKSEQGKGICFTRENNANINAQIEYHFAQLVQPEHDAKTAQEEKGSLIQLEREIDLQRKLLLPGDPKTSLQRKIFLRLRREMLMDRQDVKKVIAETSKLARLVVSCSLDNTERDPLELAIAHDYADMATTLLELFSPAEREKILTGCLESGDHRKKTPLHAVIFLDHISVLTAMLDALPPKRQIKVLTTSVNGLNLEATPLYVAASLGRAAALKVMLKALSFEGCTREFTTSVLNFGTESSLTASLCIAVAKDHVDVLEVILAALLPEERMRALITPIKFGPNKGKMPLYVAALKGNTAALNVMLKSLSPKEQKEVLVRPFKLQSGTETSILSILREKHPGLAKTVEQNLPQANDEKEDEAFEIETPARLRLGADGGLGFFGRPPHQMNDGVSNGLQP